MATVLDTAPVMVARRPLWRRVLRVAGGLFATLLALAVVALALLHTPWGKSFVRGRVESKLGGMVNGQVSVGSLDYSFLFRSIEVGDVTIKDAQGRPAIALGKLTVDLDRGSLVAGAPVIDELVLEGVDVTVVQTADGRSNLTGLFKKSDRKPLASIAVKRIAVSGSATVTKADGTVVAVRDLGVAGSVTARPAAHEVDVLLQKIAAQVAITPPSSPTRQLALAIDDVTLGRRQDAVDVEIKKLAVGALGIEGIAAHVRLADGHLAGAQSITLGKARVDSKQLTEFLGREVLLDDIAVEASVTGPADKLAIHGTVKTKGAKLALDGTADVSNRARPTYQLALVGRELRSAELVKGALPVETELRVELAGAGATPGDIDAELALAIGPTKVKGIAVEGLEAKATAHRGAYKLERFSAHGLGFEVAAAADVAADKTVHGKLTVGGSPAEAMKVLAAAGIAIPRKAPLLKRLDLAVTASGKLDGEVAVELAPTRIAIAGGTIGLAGSAKLEKQKLQTATTRIELQKLDLAALARLAGKPPKLGGSLSALIYLDRTATTQNADYKVWLDLAKPAVELVLSGSANATGASAHVDVTRARGKAVLATLDADLPLDKKGFARSGPWHVKADLARRQLGELADLLPEKLRGKVPAGTVELHADIAGTPERPRGTIKLAVDSAQNVALDATIAPTPTGVAIVATGDISLDNVPGSVAKLAATVALPKQLDPKQATVDATIEIPDRELASLASLRPKLAELGGKIGGRIAVRGPASAPALDGALRWHDYRTATGAGGDTELALAGTPKQLTATITHAGALTIVADVDRRDPARIGIHARAKAAETPLLPLIPAFAAAKLPTKELGSLSWDMDGTFVLENGKLAQSAVTGTLDVTGGAFAIPHSERRLHDIGLHVAADEGGLRIQSLEVHESDLEVKDRRLAVTGHLAMDHFKPNKLELSLKARDWLLFGGPTFGQPDAPRGAADFEIAVAADLTTPIIGVDATVRQLRLRAPDRQDRGHQDELASTVGDVIYLDATSGPAGKLPVTPVAPPAPRHVRPLDIRVHIPQPIRLEQAPFDVMARGELAITVRDEGTQTRGKLVMESGKLYLFGYYHDLKEGSLEFTDEHPKGWLALTFARPLPDMAMRELARASGEAGVKFAGPPTKPKTQLGGSANGALAEVMAMYNTGHPVYVTRPGLPASATVQAPRGDQLFVLTFMASNLPHLLFLDRVTAYADPYAGRGNYGHITNVEAEHYARRSRVRAVVRPPAPGRSSAELQWDRLFLRSDRAQAGVGVRAGDRGGGGVGVFLEWSSD